MLNAEHIFRWIASDCEKDTCIMHSCGSMWQPTLGWGGGGVGRYVASGKENGNRNVICSLHVENRKETPTSLLPVHA